MLKCAKKINKINKGIRILVENAIIHGQSKGSRTSNVARLWWLDDCEVPYQLPSAQIYNNKRDTTYVMYDKIISIRN